jgi:hypothetical protein
MNAKDWIGAYAEALGVEPPTPAEWTAILDLAGEAAHASERVAAPVACWLVAKSGRPLDEAMKLAGAVAPGDTVADA